jgi:hypothetical protein
MNSWLKKISPLEPLREWECACVLGGGGRVRHRGAVFSKKECVLAGAGFASDGRGKGVLPPRYTLIARAGKNLIEEKLGPKLYM